MRRINVFRLAAGRVVEVFELSDVAGFGQQLGLLPPPG